MAAPPPISSGAMYSGVPQMLRSSPSRGALTSRAMPKSTTFTVSWPVRRCSTMMLSLFRSAWITPARCASSTPARIWSTIASTRAGGSGCSLAIRWVKVGPRRYSITRYSRPSLVCP